MIRIHPDYLVYPRLGNQLFIRAYARFLSQKNGFRSPGVSFTGFSIPGTAGEERHPAGPVIHDDRAAHYLREPLPDGASLAGYFQGADLLHDEEYRAFLAGDSFRISPHLINPAELFVHVRAGDIGGDNRMLPLRYYEEAIAALPHARGVIATDTPDHPTVQSLRRRYDLGVFHGEPAETVLRGASYSNLVLGLGSFSFWIGLMAASHAEIHTITMGEAKEKYGTTPWHPDYDLSVIRPTLSPQG